MSNILSKGPEKIYRERRERGRERSQEDKADGAKETIRKIGEGNAEKQLPSWLRGSAVKNPPAKQEMQETRVQSLGREDPLEKEMATHSSTCAWRSPWTEESGRLQSTV